MYERKTSIQTGIQMYDQNTHTNTHTNGFDLSQTGNKCIIVVKAASFLTRVLRLKSVNTELVVKAN